MARTSKPEQPAKVKAAAAPKRSAKAKAATAPRRSTRAKAVPSPGPQAPRGAWTPADLSAALHEGTIEEKIALLRTAGILNEKGELAPKYRSWGTRVSRTPEEVEEIP
ncbi:MAG TPA: hypothetical protein VLS89_15675 [Candidatus Nanopelagicales bacterium]|nr:hypothetical protein [Candidatus Nanopelagicales bacterium]